MALVIKTCFRIHLRLIVYRTFLMLMMMMIKLQVFVGWTKLGTHLKKKLLKLNVCG